MSNTPISILESAKRYFPTLLHGMGDGEEDVLPSLLVDAVREYQDRAGFTGTLSISEQQNTLEGGIPLPGDWLERISSTDSGLVHVAIDIYDKEIPSIDPLMAPEVVKYIRVKRDAGGFTISGPYSISYYRDIAGLLSDTELLRTLTLPRESLGIIRRYLQLLIEIPNNQRLSEVYRGMDHPAVEQITPNEVLYERKKEIELEMDEQLDFLPPVMVL